MSIFNDKQPDRQGASQNWDRPNRQKLWRLLLMILAILATILLAAGLSNLQLRPGQPFPMAGLLRLLNQSTLPLPGGFSIPAGVVYFLTGCFWVMLFISIVAFIISPQVRKDVFKRVTIYLVWFLLFVALFRVLQPHLPKFEQPPQPPAQAGLPGDQTSTELMPTPPDFIANPPDWFVISVSILIVALPLVILWLLWRFFATAKVANEQEEETPPIEALTQEAQRALDGIRAGENLKDTILRCYHKMSRILNERHDLRRPQGMTAREFEQYLAQSGFRSEHIQQLTRLFERVRYGNQAPSRRQEQEAMACLTAIVNSYGRPS